MHGTRNLICNAGNIRIHTGCDQKPINTTKILQSIIMVICVT